MRYAAAVAGLVAAWFATPSAALDIREAVYSEPTTRYAHGVLGDAIEWGALELRGADGKLYRIHLPEYRVFEDTAPRLVDVDGDGEAEVVVVESDTTLGARLAVYDTEGLVSATKFIGTSNRWLAPVGIGAADLDGDGQVELAYVDRPHLAKTLRIFRFAPDALVPLADLPGVTNHRIGETDIAGGIRNCGGLPELIVASADWSRVMAVRFDGTGFTTRDAGRHRGRESFDRALGCN
ncbi:VCBS repeat-containing protein [Alphaproteobacteria bacterium GH1-50]|uniref:VCBS repeat-containing protein n=1 Tax=Kangsaoukella pontilimi TaxID=2691042 RepID=A0A7C9MAR9_9RHOB|nr:VCBS repeat-containing protein [Kangsaoukella pontilimi]MXQ06371.1 VCBS repeat-containing protein [Kangsaoukella pontilimi]